MSEAIILFPEHSLCCACVFHSRSTDCCARCSCQQFSICKHDLIPVSLWTMEAITEYVAGRVSLPSFSPAISPRTRKSGIFWFTREIRMHFAFICSVFHWIHSFGEFAVSSCFVHASQNSRSSASRLETLFPCLPSSPPREPGDPFLYLLSLPRLVLHAGDSSWNVASGPQNTWPGNVIENRGED